MNGADLKNLSVADFLERLKELMSLAEENPFKVRAFDKAADLARTTHAFTREEWAERAKAGTLTELEGIGKGISEALTEFLLKGESGLLVELGSKVPAGLIELTQVPGLGPKKARVLVEELGISSLSELEYAIRENRLLGLKGFGEKVQNKILEGVEFLRSTQGQARLSDVMDQADAFCVELAQALAQHGVTQVSQAGELRRRMEILSTLDFAIGCGADSKSFKPAQAEAAKLQAAWSSKLRLPVTLHWCDPASFGSELLKLSASAAHLGALFEVSGAAKVAAHASEEALYESLGLPFIAPECRETGEEVAIAKNKQLDSLLAWDGVQGVFHNHTTRSDGTATLEQMVIEAKSLGLKYIGISDHSKSAFYAQGLKEDALKEQERELKEVQAKHPEIKIFWGVESDILADGSLDYEESVLKRFDFVVASVHSRFGMDRDAMTARIVKAIQNPHTRFVGHLTGRLLLGRKGYDIDFERVLKEAARCDVAIEINANPQRLDIDWRYGGMLRANQTLVSVNPDAHDIEGLSDTRYGVAMARKALMPSSLVVNSKGVKEVSAWLKRA